LKLAGPLAAAEFLSRTVGVCGAAAAEAGPAAPAAEPDGLLRGRLIPPLKMPCVECKGTALESGRMLGEIWKQALLLEAERSKGSKPWWKSRRYTPLVEKYAPHLPDVYRGMARGAGVSEDAMANGPGPKKPVRGARLSPWRPRPPWKAFPSPVRTRTSPRREAGNCSCCV